MFGMGFFRGIEQKSVFKILAFSMFIDESGPTPMYCFPKEISNNKQMNIAMKSISLLMGEGVYQSGFEFENLKYFGILPFPDLDMVGLTYFFLIRDENVRGKAKAATITILVEEKDSKFIYENIKTLRFLLDKTSSKFSSSDKSEQIKDYMDDLKEELENFNFRKDSINRLVKRVKIVFTGLDNSGKTSFLRSVESKYSELMGIAPTKGIERREKELLGTKLLEWDFGGQSNYRHNYFKNAEMYLSEIDLLFYILDLQDQKRIEESLSYLNQILTTLESFKQFPPVIILLHKMDPDIVNKPETTERVEYYKKLINTTHNKWSIQFFPTTIFDQWSIISAFSYAISQLSPNREVFRNHLKWITKKMDGKASILLTRNAIILSDYSTDWVTGKFFEVSQADFYNLFLKFEEFGLLSNDYLLWEIEDFNILLKKFFIDDKEFFILLQVKNIDKNLPKLSGYVDFFKKKITPHIHNYI